MKFSMASEYLPSARAWRPLKRNTSLSYWAMAMSSPKETMAMTVTMNFATRRIPGQKIFCCCLNFLILAVKTGCQDKPPKAKLQI